MKSESAMSAECCRPEIQGLIFDFGNVIYRFDHERCTAALSRLCGLESDEIRRRLFSESDIEWDYMAGNLGSDGFLEQCSQACGYAFDRNAFLDAYLDIFTPQRDILDLIRALKPHYKLGLISDTAEWHFEQVIQKCEVYPLFDAVVASYLERRMKPDYELFHTCLRGMGVKPEACVFIDDVPKHIAGARAMGLHAHTYRTYTALEAELHRLGVRFTPQR